MGNISHQDQGEPTLGLQDTEKYKTSSIGLILGLAPVTAQHKVSCWKSPSPDT